MARKSIFSFVVLALLVGIVTARPTSVADRSSEPTKFQQLHAEHFQRVSAIVEELIDSSVTPDGSHSFLAGFVRVIFHDCVGVSCDGCINLEYGPNAGLLPYVTALNKTYHCPHHKIYEILSQADFWALAGVVAARRGALKGGQTLATKFRTGRVDCPTSPHSPYEDEYPDAHGDTTKTLDYWKDFFGLTYHETTALLGAHSLGKCHKNASGFSGPWTSDKDSLDNTYYQDLTNSHLGWHQKYVDEEHVQWVHGDGTKMMLNSDMALYKDIKPHPLESDCTYETCKPSRVAASVEMFASNNALFVSEFSSAFEKMIQHGYPLGTLKQVAMRPSQFAGFLPNILPGLVDW